MSEMIQLTLPQQDVYFEQLLFPNDPIYNIGAKIKIEGTIAVVKMQEAYKVLLQQHNTYRSAVHYKNDSVSFLELESYNDVLEVIDFSNEINANEKATAFMQERFLQPFDLKETTLLHKFILIQIDAEYHYLFSVYHHIITDGWGTSLMFQRLVANYNELVTDGKVISEYPYHYDAFIVDDLQYQQSETYEKDKAYWKLRFQNLPEPLFQPIKGEVLRNKSQRKKITIKRETYNQLATIAKTCKSNTFHAILGLLYLYFGRKQRNKDFAIGLPVLNRGKSIFKKTVGLFMGVSALRMQLEEKDTFTSFLGKIRQQLRQDYRYQRFPLGKLIQQLEMFQERKRLFDITLSYEKQNYSDHFTGTKTTVIPLTHQSERVALALYIREFDATEDVTIDFDYNSSYFDEKLISQVTTHFEELIQQVIQNPMKKLGTYTYLTVEEKFEVCETFNQTQFEYPKQQTILDYFKKQVVLQPEKIAIVDQNNSYTYQQLDELSDNIAKHIITNFEVAQEHPIAILMPRSTKFITGILGIMKSGRSYIPLDPKFPNERLQYIISHSEVASILTSDEMSEVVVTHKNMISIESLFTTPNVSVKLPKITGEKSGYIIYTSGTTGNPKGVEIGHQALLNLLLSIEKHPRIEQNDVLYSVTTQSFDISILEFLTPLLVGASVYVAASETLEDAFAVIEEIQKVHPTIIQATPSFYQLLFNAGWEGNNQLKILCGGDLLSEALAEKLLSNSKELWNMYGPTETTIWSTCKHITKPTEASNIGAPIHNTQIYILDDTLQVIPKQSTGTIYIGGDGLAKGYYKNTTLTNERFIQHKQLQQCLYNTGDLGKWNTKGEIEFLGREDFQVKIRGYRIELADIEVKFNEIPTVKETVVIAKKQHEQEAYLVAFLVVNDTNVNIDDIQEIIKKQMPTYMVPGRIVLLEALPLTPNKKVDRKALTVYKLENPIEGKNSFKKATTVVEKELCQLFKEVLNVEIEIGTTDNFFANGGHSLNAVKLISDIEIRLHYSLSLRVLFDYPTVSELIHYIKEHPEEIQKETIPKVTKQDYYPITTVQQEIWIASQQSERSIAYNMFAAYKVLGKIQVQKLQMVFVHILSKYEILRTNFIEIAGIPQQKINETTIGFTINEIECTNVTIEETIQNDVHQPFDLENDVLCKFTLYKSDTDMYLVFNTHHSIMDGWSLELLIQEVIQLYTLEDISGERNQLKLQYKDYAVWQQQKQTHQNYTFWESYLKDYSWKELITVNKNIQENHHNGASIQIHYNVALWNQITQITQQQQLTIHTFLATTFSILLAKNYEHDEVCIGTINSGRNHASLQSQLGMFVKTLPLRTKLNDKQSLFSVWKEAQTSVIDFHTYQDVPEKLRKDFRWDVLLVLQNQSFNYEEIIVSDKLSFTSHYIESLRSRLPLLLNFTVANSLSVTINYDAEKFDKETITLLFMRFEKLLKQATQATKKTTVGELNIQLDSEKTPSIDIDFNF